MGSVTGGGGNLGQMAGTAAAGSMLGVPLGATLIPGVANNGALKSLGGQFQQNGGLFGQQGAAPEMANIQQGTSVEDVQKAQQGVGNSLQSQQSLLAALQAQGGLGMQNTAANNFQGLANQYQNIANGTGPNPAQAMLNQATGANVANQAALMAGQRGAGANVGLMARQAAQQGAATQQQAVGQGATMQANQQLNALTGLTGAQQAYANQANQIAGQQIGQTNQGVQSHLANQSAMQNALQGVNNSNVASQGSLNTGNVGLSQSNAKAKQDVVGGIMNSLGPAAAAAGARGGMVHMDLDGSVPMAAPVYGPQPAGAPAPAGPVSDFGKFMNTGAFAPDQFAPPVYGPEAPPKEEEESEELVKKQDAPKKENPNDSPLKKGTQSLASGLGKGAQTAMAFKGGMAKAGGKVQAKTPSQKPVKEGNSYANDKVPAMLSAGEIVLPRSVTQSNDPVRASADFVAKVLAKRRVK